MTGMHHNSLYSLPKFICLWILLWLIQGRVEFVEPVFLWVLPRCLWSLLYWISSVLPSRCILSFSFFLNMFCFQEAKVCGQSWWTPLLSAFLLGAASGKSCQDMGRGKKERLGHCIPLAVSLRDNFGLAVTLPKDHSSLGGGPLQMSLSVQVPITAPSSSSFQLSRGDSSVGTNIRALV